MKQSLKVDQSYQSPNFLPETIPVEFIVLHYTAVSFEKTIEIFQSAKPGVSSHLVIDEKGAIFELVSCVSGPVYRTFHAGRSALDVGGKSWKEFNEISIGIELVNKNGNIFDYTEAQYKSLINAIRYFQGQYPALQSSDRVIGHEQIAGYRGKVDPGHCFDWSRIWKECFPDETPPSYSAKLPEEYLEPLRAFKGFCPCEQKSSDDFWMNVSLLLELAGRERA